MPPKGRIKHANQHDKRHDTGLAAPGKRITKDRTQSSGSTNGHTNGKTTGTNPPPLPSTGLNQGITYPRPDYPSTDSDASGTPGDKAVDVQEQGADANGSLVDDETDMNHKLAIVDRSGSESVCTRDTPTLKALASQATSTMAFAATILSACPMRDAIAILILLLSLPPTLLIVIHGLFISLTLVPPAAGLSWASIFTIPNLSPSTWFHGTAGGGPSPFTMMCTDLVMIAIYLVCTLRLRNILMDLAQAVIAISLSGAAAGTGSSTRSIAVCSAIIVVSHIYRYESFHVTSLQYFGNFARSLGFSFSADSFWSSQGGPQNPINHGWSRLILGCHILAQGLLTLIRRWFAASNARRQASKLDAEQAALLSSGKLAMLNLETVDPAVSVSTDGRSPGPSPAVRDSKEKVSNSRRKRKQANQVRSQQPLWAAIASTKVTFMKELEHKALLNDAIETTEGTPLVEGLAPSPPTNDRIWVLDIGPTQIKFRAELFASAYEHASAQSDDIVPPSPGIDKQKPFYVRLNGADWGSSRIYGAGGDGGAAAADNITWTGEIYGLSPLTKYSCEFVRMQDQHVICSTNLITLPAPNTEQGDKSCPSRKIQISDPFVAISVPAPPQHQSLRPMSPTSTLKQSIAAAESKREEVRNKLKRTRKDHKSAASAVRREIDQLQAKVNSAGGQDEKSKQRHLQIQQQIKQTKEAMEAIAEEMESMGEIPKDDLDRCKARRKSYDAALEAKNAAKSDFDKTKCDAAKQLAALQAEMSTIAQKRDRLNIRRTKLQEQQQRLVSEQNADMTIRQHREQSRAEIREERVRRIEQMAFWINASRASAEDFTIRANQFYQQFEATEQAAHLQQPTTPEGNLPGTNGPLGPVQQPFEFPAFTNLVQPPPQQMQKWGGRQRSSSMLSGYSGFTDDLDVPHQNGEYERKGSGGSGSSGRSASDGTVPWGHVINGNLAPVRPASTEYKGKK
ncbi:1,3-beta-glucanosyltransferase [Sphaceloma murrayae]|uniref:1,3-beta-glucanosyltransferase n=1 Tax=Sphaceloma murrayae TaxID=2082308 RepID=A0A2K1R231_9PEZI|nr:1,3-beta-glucanosyltransferase [Sphaceloma murrayae]